MELTAIVGGARYAVDLTRPHDLSIRMRFEGEQVAAFGAPLASRESLVVGRFAGDVSRGGSCNCDVLHFCPHTSGTHTEGVGHITRQRIALPDLLSESLFPATLVTIDPVPAGTTGERYHPAPEPADRLVTRAALEAALASSDPGFLRALAVRTTPNDAGKRTRRYGSAMPPYFTNDAMRLLLERGVLHLLCDLPSIDRMEDQGVLSNHRLFWETGSTGHELEGRPSGRTVTELIFAGEAIPDGPYLLDLGIASIDSDAVPSRPLLYEVSRL